MSNSQSYRRLAGLALPVLLAALGGFVLLIVVGSLWTIHSNQALLRSEHRHSAGLVADGLATALRGAVMRKDYAAIEAHLGQTAALPGVHSALATDSEGEVLGHVARSGPNEAVQPIFLRPGPPPPDTGATAMESETDTLLTLWRPIEVGMPIGWVRLEVGLERVLVMSRRTMWETWLVSLAGIIAGLLLLVEGTRRALDRLHLREQELRATQDHLENIAFHDALTGLPNRRLLDDRLRQAMARAQRDRTLLAVCFLDIDGLKEVNDDLGHDTGDRLLLEFARRLSGAIRADDTVARLGGDEFVVLFCNLASTAEVELAIERLMADLGQPLHLAGRDMPCRSSLGYALYPDDATCAEELLGLADAAMYEAKKSGGATCRRTARG